jgi:hypothetical protein
MILEPLTPPINELMQHEREYLKTLSLDLISPLGLMKL